MRKGEAYLGSILVLLILVSVFAVLFTRYVRVKASPIVDGAFWLTDDQKVTTAYIRSKVEAHVVIRATGEYVGSVVVTIRKDIALWLDKDYAVVTAPVSLSGGEKTEITLDFVPDETSVGRLRGYFVEVGFSVTKTKWVMENSYPPRLAVMNSGT